MAKKLLLADDSITIQKVVGITLANEDLEITSVDNGEDAIARARAQRPDLVLADASMPRKDGYQVAEALKGDPATASIPVLILAGQLEGHPDQARLTACRADGFIPKPFQSQELIDRVRRILGLSGPVAIPAPRVTGAAPPAAPGSVPAARPTNPPPSTAPPLSAQRPAVNPMSQTLRSPTAPLAAAAPPAPAPVPVPLGVDETDFGDLSGAPAASGDQDLWGGGTVEAKPDENLWGSMGEPGSGPGNGKAAPPAPAAMPSSMNPSNLVTNPAELANLDKFGDPDDSPSGLDLDDARPGSRERAGDDNLVHPTDAMLAAVAAEGGNPFPAPVSAPAGGGSAVSASAAAALAGIPPEKLEAIVREVARSILQPILEKIAWEVVPDLAEDIIKDEIKRLTQPN